MRNQDTLAEVSSHFELTSNEKAVLGFIFGWAKPDGFIGSLGRHRLEETGFSSPINYVMQLKRKGLLVNRGKGEWTLTPAVMKFLNGAGQGSEEEDGEEKREAAATAVSNERRQISRKTRRNLDMKADDESVVRLLEYLGSHADPESGEVLITERLVIGGVLALAIDKQDFWDALAVLERDGLLNRDIRPNNTTVLLLKRAKKSQSVAVTAPEVVVEETVEVLTRVHPEYEGLPVERVLEMIRAEVAEIDQATARLNHIRSRLVITLEVLAEKGLPR